MVTSNVMRCALLAASVNKQNHLFQSNYLAGLAALGLYELEPAAASPGTETAASWVSRCRRNGRTWRGCTSPSPGRRITPCGACWG